MANLFTIGQIAQRAERPIHKVQYIIRSRNIAPAGRVGQYRVFDEAAVEAIMAELGSHKPPCQQPA